MLVPGGSEANKVQLPQWNRKHYRHYDLRHEPEVNQQETLTTKTKINKGLSIVLDQMHGMSTKPG